MVKNLGGNKAKKFASKSFNAPQRPTRFSEEEGEIYAIVNKLMGGSICEVLCIDGITRTCVIRGKFSGKGKRDNIIMKGKWLLVGLRDWEVTTKDKQRCDLLVVYNDTDKEKLIKNSKDSFRVFLSINNEEEEFDKDQIEFINSRDEELELEEENDDNDSDNDNRQGKENEENEEATKKNITTIIEQVDWVDINDI